MNFKLNVQAMRAALQAVDDPKILSGSAVARAVRGEVERAVDLLHDAGIHPRLAVVRVGDDPASEIYVRHKVRDCEETGIGSEQHVLPASIGRDELFGLLSSLNLDPTIDGILLQLPLPSHIDEVEAIGQISPRKDVDGFHPANLGRLMAWLGALEPCTPRGIMTMLHAADIDLRGLNAVVVGRSMIVGRPMAQMLVRADATTTVCHRFTRGLDDFVRQADLLVVATGVPGLIDGDWIREGAVVVDVGISRVDGRLVGDVDFEGAYRRASRITPVPGGVGPMTRATLLENTIRACCDRHHVAIDSQGLRRLS